MASEGQDTDRGRVSFAGSGWRGEVAARYAPADDRALLAEVERLVDPESATETIHWGRNYIYAASFGSARGPLAVVVKQFRNQGWRRRLERRLRGSKAERSWRAALALRRAGIETPEPVMLVESDRAEGPSFYISRRLSDAFEVRHFFRRLNREPEPGEFPEVEPEAFLEQLGALGRRLHQAGIWYRDLSLGNVLARADGDGVGLWVVDSNRARVGRRLGLIRRCRDICRFPVLDRRHRAAYLRGYWGEVPARISPRWWFYVLCVRGYLLKHAVKNRLRRRTRVGRHVRRGCHAHIPEAAEGSAVRDRIVWDRLSDQPHQHASGFEKAVIRLVDAPSHLRDLGIVAAAAPRVWRRYRDLQSGLYTTPARFGGLGVGLRPWPAGRDAHLAAVEELGVRSALIRLHPWEQDHGEEEWLAHELRDRGFELAFALPQSRELVRDRRRWRAAVEKLAERFAPLGRSFQVGQAINRSKWGVWTRSEYVELFRDAAEVLRGYPGVELLGPAVIDFEHHMTMALVNRRDPGLHFDVVSSLLYVDRRGAPENRQLGFDTVDKVVLLRAIAETGRSSSARCWITEVNWPLWEGPHSPAGRTVSVDEETQADYLARYYLLVLSTGLVERVFWWRLLARGYGLVAPEADGGLRRRPSFFAFKNLGALLDGATFLGPLPAPPGVYLYRFQREDGELVAGWCLEGSRQVDLPRPAAEVIERDGGVGETPTGVAVEVTPSPRYYRLTAE